MATMGVLQERRLFERIPARFPTRYRDSSIDFGSDVFLKDFSATGACIATKERLLLDDVVSLEVKVPDGMDAVPLNGRVRWVHRITPRIFEAGVEFHKVELLHLHRIMKFALAAS